MGVYLLQIKVNRGTNQIGGCITEIESSKGTRIIIDIGSNLPDSDSLSWRSYRFI